MPERLYGLQDIARAYGVSASAVSNWNRRDSGPTIPEPTYCARYGNRELAPLWTADQLRAIIADRAASALTLLEGES